MPLTVVTGASDGIGRELAIRLARAGAELALPVRDQAKGAAAAAAVRQAVPGARLRLEALDLADPASVAALTDRLIGEGRPINLLSALELGRRSRAAGWGITSNAATPGPR